MKGKDKLREKIKDVPRLQPGGPKYREPSRSKSNRKAVERLWRSGRDSDAEAVILGLLD